MTSYSGGMARSPYRYVRRKDHPLTFGNTTRWIPEHRLILWEKIGPGTHPCHWCGTSVTWLPGGRTAKGCLVTDHVDRNQKNNEPDNLVPSCQGCNIRRGKGDRFDDGLFVMIEGKRAVATPRVCLTCDEPFLIATKYLKKANAGRYCSRRCMYDRDRAA
jgi:hypothetical protein